MKKIYIASVVVGSILGIASTTFLFVGSAFALIPWSIGGMLLGFFISSKREILMAGGLYGFIISLSFLVSGDKNFHISVLFLFCVLSAFGAVCGIVLALIGCLIKKATSSKSGSVL